MISEIENDLFYVCSLIEYTARKTKNHRAVIVKSLGLDGVSKQLHDAGLNHCLPFDQVSDELIEQYQIPFGTFDTISNCKYKVPGYLDIGRLYSIIILNSSRNKDIAVEIINVFSSFISDKISEFSSDLYYQNPDYLVCSYQAGYLLD